MTFFSRNSILKGHFTGCLFKQIESLENSYYFRFPTRSKLTYYSRCSLLLMCCQLIFWRRGQNFCAFSARGASFISGKGIKCPSTEEWIKMWHIHAMEYYSAIKRNKTVPFAEMWMDLEIVIQSEISKKEKNKYSIISLICGI